MASHISMVRDMTHLHFILNPWCSTVERSAMNKQTWMLTVVKTVGTVVLEVVEVVEGDLDMAKAACSRLLATEGIISVEVNFT